MICLDHILVIEVSHGSVVRYRALGCDPGKVPIVAESLRILLEISHEIRRIVWIQNVSCGWFEIDCRRIV